MDVTGIVQGVGFRPFVHGLAAELDLTGWVENNDAGVAIEVQGRSGRVEEFVEAVSRRPPPLAVIDELDRCEIEVRPDDDGFRIVASSSGGAATTLVSPDVATCPDCIAELWDPDDRRFEYPFINCTNCGPRYSIINDIPYDRPYTTMAAFTMCESCQAEYDDPRDRRFHAQPVCCPRCGPTLDVSIAGIVAALRRGEIVALKGLGGYHLTVLADNEAAVARLRARKHREDKPFAVMVPNLAHARVLCEIDDAEQTLLSSIARPIVLLKRRDGAPVAEAVAPMTGELGVMLPYTPLHHLVMNGLGTAMVCTSANISDEPIAYRDEEARRRLADIADSFVGHDRPIHIRVDDSVTRVVAGAPTLIRRSRGYAPAPLAVPWAAPRPILACGAELKNTIAYARDRHVFLSHHIGDLRTLETHRAFTEAIEHLGRLFAIEPRIVARDLHPDYLSSSHAAGITGVDHIAVQHHHAHVAACLADAGHPGPVIGVAFDGMGYGTDGTVWGGEFLVADLVSHRRAGWFSPVRMPGGDAATTEPWRMAAAYLDVIGDAAASDLDVVSRNPHWVEILQVARAGVNSPLTSSVGRLFDAVASILGVRDRANYEGQAAIELEQLADRSEQGRYGAAIETTDLGLVVQGPDLVAAAVEDLQRKVDPGRISARFHRGLAGVILAVCRRIRSDTGLVDVALSGGVFLNVALLVDSIELLEADGFAVLRHRRVPCNDGGISFGQAVVAAANDRHGNL